MATQGNAENDALVNTLADRLADVKVETLGEEKAKKKGEAQVGTLSDRRAEVEVKTLSVTVAELEAKKLVHTLSGRLAEMQVETTSGERGLSKCTSSQCARYIRRYRQKR